MQMYELPQVTKCSKIFGELEQPLVVKISPHMIQNCEIYLSINIQNMVGKINSQSIEDTQVGYISQKYTLDQYTLEEYTLEVVQKYIYIFEHLSPHIHFRAFKPSYTFLSI